MLTNLTVADLSPVEQSYLGVLSLGLVSADLAHDDRFLMEHVVAVAHALRLGEPAETYRGAGEFEASDPFREELRHALIDLDIKRVIGIGPPQDLAILRPSTPPEQAYGTVDINRHPPIFDRYLAQRCMDELFAVPAVYDYLMGLYAISSEIWGRLHEQGYGAYR
jgi:hypothetical protein